MITSSGWRSGDCWGIAPCGVGSIDTSCGFPRQTTHNGDVGYAHSADETHASARRHHTKQDIV
jgi:hypothetical protein